MYKTWIFRALKNIPVIYICVRARTVLDSPKKYFSKKMRKCLVGQK